MTLEEEATDIDTIEPIDAPVEPVEGEEAVQTEEDGPLVVQIGDDAPEEEEAKAPEWVRDLRKRDRENQKRIKELEAQLGKPADRPAPSPEPTLESCEYDEDQFKVEWRKWNAEEAKREAAEREVEAQARAMEEAWQAKVASYNDAKAKLPVADYDDAEAFVQDTFDQTQQGLLIKIANDAPTLVYALGKNPAKAAALAGIKDYAEFVAAAVRLEMSVKTTRKPATSPEKSLNVPTGTGVASTDSTLERLREEAAKTGDYTKVVRYKREKRK
jgi:hypothetical protein